jgi:hypothetical protein
MATVAELEAAAAKFEAAGQPEKAAQLRAYAKTLPQEAPAENAAAQPARADLEAAAEKFRAAGQIEKADKLTAYAATVPAPEVPSAPVAPQPESPTAAAPMVPTETMQQEKTPEQKLAEFEAANPVLVGRYKVGDVLPNPGTEVQYGGGGKSGPGRYTVQARPDTGTFGDTAKTMMEGPLASASAFGAGIFDPAQSPSARAIEADPYLSQLPGFAQNVLGAVGDIGGAGLSLLGAGMGGAAGLASETVPGQNAAGEKKFAEDALSMSMFAVPELAGFSSVVGKAATTANAAKVEVPQIGTKEWRNAYGASEVKPSVESLRTAKNEAYKAVDEAGEVFEADEMAVLRDTVKSELDAGNYVSGVDKQTDAVVSLLDRKAGDKMTLGQLDKLRQEFYKRLEAAPNEVGIYDAIDAIDAMIAGKASASELMDAARLSNSRYKKAELLDLAFQRAADQTAGTGSGGNIMNKYIQAVTSIVNSPKKVKWFNKDEVAAMREFIAGGTGRNILRRIGKLSPSGNGLMMALNLGAAGATGGSSLLLTGLATGAKAIADRAAIRGGEDLISKVAGGAPPVPVVAPKAATSGASVPLPAVPAAAANSTQQPDYLRLYERY